LDLQTLNVDLHSIERQHRVLGNSVWSTTQQNSNDSPSVSFANTQSDLGMARRLPKVPSRSEFLKAIEGSKTVRDLIAEFKNRFALKRLIKEDQKNKLMVGRTNFQLPDTYTLKKTFSKR